MPGQVESGVSSLDYLRSDKLNKQPRCFQVDSMPPSFNSLDPLDTWLKLMCDDLGLHSPGLLVHRMDSIPLDDSESTGGDLS